MTFEIEGNLLPYLTTISNYLPTYLTYNSEVNSTNIR